MNHKIKIKQHDITDCGAACLASIAAHYGLKLPISRIRQYAFTDKKGTNILGIIEAAKKLGLEAKGVKGPFECLTEIPKPAIAHVVVKEVLQHFVVIYKVTDKYILIMDPGDGKLHKKSHEEFKKEWTGILVLLHPTETFQKGNLKKSTLKSFIELLRPHKSVMGQALFGALVYSILGLSTAIYVGKITDYVLVDRNINLLNLMGILMILIILLRTFVGSMKSILALKTGQRIDASLILGYYKHLLTLPQQFFDTMRVGEIISRVNDAVKIRNFINNVSLDLAVNLLIMIFTLIVMFVYSWKLAAITLVSAPLFILTYVLFNRLNKKYQRSIMESSAELESQLVESLNSIATIKRFGIESFANLKTEIRFVHLLKNTYTNAYLTQIGEHGVSLSGGEKQRIAIARALYKNPEILIFDEATSSLDSISEKYVKRTLSALAKEGKTIIIIAHRLSTVKHADTIIVLENGKMMESGTHDQLIHSDGIYYKLWNEQFNQI